MHDLLEVKLLAWLTGNPRPVYKNPTYIPPTSVVAPYKLFIPTKALPDMGLQPVQRGMGLGFAGGLRF
jgi:hypothetical protein